MVWTIVSTDVTSTQTILSAGDTFSLSRDASILVEVGHGVATSTTVYDTNVFVFGEIIARNHGITLGTSDGTAAGIGSNEIFIGSTGAVTSLFGSQYAISLRGTSNDVVNHGEIQARNVAIRINGDHSEVVNSGLIQSTESYAVMFDGETTGGISTLINSGQIAGDTAVRASHESLGLVNTGVISGTSASVAVYLTSDGHFLDLENHGTIETLGSYAVVARDGDDSIYNYGRITGSVSLSAGSNLFLNTGLLTGSYLGGLGEDTVSNSGHIVGNISLSSGNDHFDGRGGTVNGIVFGGQGDDTYIIDDANIQLSENNFASTDLVQSLVGWKLGVNFENLDLLGNADLRGSGNGENNVITGNIGDNTIYGQGGNDTLMGDDGDDFLSGQSGNDTLEGGAGDDELRGGRGNDTLIGGTGNDDLRGGRGHNVIEGGDGDDRLTGGGGNDTIGGDGGDDVLIGRNGLDTLTGGDGADLFVFQRISDSDTLTDADHITDFVIGEDLIDLSSFSGAFEFLGSAAFSSTGAEVRVTTSGANTRVRIDVDGDGVTDMNIIINGVIGLTEQDFLL